jgi:hypothetical protein
MLSPFKIPFNNVSPWLLFEAAIGDVDRCSYSLTMRRNNSLPAHTRDFAYMKNFIMVQDDMIVE